MPWRPITSGCILAIGVAAALLAFAYGPSRRTYVSPPRVATVSTAVDAYGLWQSNGIRGRIALVFSGSLVPAAYGLTDAERAAAAPEVEAIERAMHHGMIREVYHVIPDDRWQGMAFGLSHISIYRSVGSGVVGAFEDGRVNVLPLSRLWPMDETTLILLEPATWSRAELGAIARRIGSGALKADLIAVVKGTSSELELFTSAQAASVE